MCLLISIFCTLGKVDLRHLNSHKLNEDSISEAGEGKPWAESPLSSEESGEGQTSDLTQEHNKK